MGALMWVDIKGDLQDYAKENVNFTFYSMASIC